MLSSSQDSFIAAWLSQKVVNQRGASRGSKRSCLPVPGQSFCVGPKLWAGRRSWMVSWASQETAHVFCLTGRVLCHVTVLWGESHQVPRTENQKTPVLGKLPSLGHLVVETEEIRKVFSTFEFEDQRDSSAGMNTCHQAYWPELSPLNPGGRKQIPGYPLAFTLIPMAHISYT